MHVADKRILHCIEWRCKMTWVFGIAVITVDSRYIKKSGAVKKHLKVPEIGGAAERTNSQFY